MGCSSCSPQERTPVDQGGLFQVGSRVEVSSDEEGFRGAWYVATIVQALSPGRRLRGNRNNGGGKDRVLVKYDTLVSEFDHSELLTEFVELPFVRPLPPSAGGEGKEEPFEPHDVVDAFHRDGWWKGVVSVVVGRDAKSDGEGEWLYNVVFEDPPHQIVFGASSLRFHLEWVDGSWTKPSKQKRMKGLTFSKGMAVEVNIEKNSSKEVWYPATIIDEVGFCSFLVTCKSIDCNVESDLTEITVDCFHIRPSPPKMETESFSMLERVDAFYDSGWTPGFIVQLLSDELCVVFLTNVKEEKQFSLLEIRPHLYWINGRWVSYSREMEINSQGKVNSKLVDENANKNLVEDPGNDKTEEDCPKLSSPRSKLGRKGVKRGTPSSGARRLSTPKRSKRRNFSDSSSETNLQLVDALNQRKVWSSAGVNPQKEINTSWQNKGKNQAVPKADISDIDDDILTTKISKLALIVHEPVAGQHSAPEGVTYDMVDRVLATDEVPLPIIAYVEHGLPEVGAIHMDNRDSAVGHVEPLMITSGASDMDNQDCAIQEVELPLLTCDEPVDVFCGEPVVVGELDNEVNKVREVELPVITGEEPAVSTDSAQIHQFCFDTDPFSCMPGASVGKSAAGQGADYVTEEKDPGVAGPSSGIQSDSQPLSIEGNSPGNGGKLCDRGQVFGQAWAPPNLNSVPLELVENAEIPFVKRAPIWDGIESMEAFQLLPQKPHFRPLVNCPEENREGVAICSMVVFANLVEKTSKLQVDDPSDLFDRYLVSLSELDLFGFDVKPLVDRLEKLLSIKERRGKLQDSSKELQDKIAAEETEIGSLDEEIAAIDKKMKELEEKRASSVAMKSAIEAKITSLQSDASALQEKFADAEQEFRSVVAAPLAIGLLT